MAMFKGLLGGAAGAGKTWGCKVVAKGYLACGLFADMRCLAGSAAMYTAYRDSDAILNSKDLASGLYEYWQKKGQANLTEVRCRAFSGA